MALVFSSPPAQHVSDDDCGSGDDDDDDDDDIDYDDEGPSAYSVRVAWLDRNMSLALVFSSPSAKITNTSVMMTGGGGDDDDDEGPSAYSVRVAWLDRHMSDDDTDL